MRDDPVRWRGGDIEPQAVVFVGLLSDGPTGSTSKVGLAGTQFPKEQRMRPLGFHLLTRGPAKPRRRPREPGVRDGSREIRPYQ